MKTVPVVVPRKGKRFRALAQLANTLAVAIGVLQTALEIVQRLQELIGTDV
jgi:hypothetical protein